MKKRVVVITASVFLAAAAILGFGKIYVESQVNQRLEKVALETEEKRKIKKEALQYLSETHSSKEIEKKLYQAFESLDPLDCTEIVDIYLYGVYNTAAQYTLTDTQTNQLARCVVSDGVFDFSSLEDGELKKQIEDLEGQHVVLKYLNGQMFWDTDYEYFDKAFGEYVIPDYRDMIHFYAEEKSRSYCSEAGDELYIQVVKDRLQELYHLLTVYPDSIVRDFMIDSYYNYKAIYLGAHAQDYIFSDGVLREEIYDSYKEFVQECKDPELKSFIEELLFEYDEVGKTRTVPIYEKIKNFCGFYVEGPSSQITQ